MTNEQMTNAEVHNVKVGQLPGQIRSVKVRAGATVGDVLRAAELNPEGYEIRVDNQPSFVNSLVKANQTVLLLRPVKGNAVALEKEAAVEAPFTVKVGQLPGQIRAVKMSTGATVADVLRAAELNSEGYEIRVDNQPTSLNATVKANQTVLLLRPVKGN